MRPTEVHGQNAARPEVQMAREGSSSHGHLDGMEELAAGAVESERRLPGSSSGSISASKGLEIHMKSP